MKTHSTKRLAIGLLASSVALAGATVSSSSSSAIPLRVSPAAQSSSLAEAIQYRGRSYRGGRSGGNFGRNAALGIGAAIIGGIVLSEAARAEHRRTHVTDWDRCSDTYRSFERDTGLYTGYDGIRRTCPYLN